MARSNSARDLILGLLFFGGLIGLAYVTTQLRNLPGVGTRQYVNVLCEDVNGVRREDSVLIHGTRYGRVYAVRPISNESWAAAGRDLADEGLATEGFRPNVLMVLELEFPIALREGYHIASADANLLGGKVVEVLPGPPGATEIDMGSAEANLDVTSAADLGKIRLVAYPRPHPLTAIGEMVDENRDGVNELIENLRSASATLVDGEEQGLLGYLLTNADAKKQGENVLAALDDLATKSGQPGSLVHDLFNDTELRQDLNAAADGARTFIDGANDPASLLGSLVAKDSELRRDLDKIVDDVDRITNDVREYTGKMNRPDSLLGKLVDEGPNSLGQRADNVFGKISGYVDDALANQDSLVYTIAYGDTGSKLDSALSKVDTELGRFSEVIMDPIADGRGALGYIINDPESRAKLDRLISATLGIIEDAREAAPVTSLGSFIFGGF